MLSPLQLLCTITNLALQLSIASATSFLPSQSHAVQSLSLTLLNLALCTMISTRASPLGQPPTSYHLPQHPYPQPYPTTMATTFLTSLLGAQIKLDNIKPLCHVGLGELRDMVSLILYAIGAKSLIISGTQPNDMIAERAANLMQQALRIII